MFPIKTDSPSLRFAIFTGLLILLNTLVFAYQFSLGEGFMLFVKKYGATPYEITHFIDLKPHIRFPIHFTLLTSIFMHGGWIHLLGNMWFLFVFGRNIETWLGHNRFLAFYLTCGIGASLVQMIFSPFSTLPTVGASGAIAGILGGYLVLYPRARVRCIFPFFFFIRIVTLPAFLFLGFWILWQILSQMTMGAVSNVAFLAHIGGFFIGFFLIRWLKLRRWR
jgi:membrane associated rhomboid family serine protease